MKGKITLGCIIALVGTLAWADTETPNPKPKASSVDPCKQIKQDCSDAGYVKGGGSR